MFELQETVKLSKAQMNVFVSPTPEEELYDFENDPFKLNNLATEPVYAEALGKMRSVLKEFMDETDYQIPETRTADEFHRETADPLPNRKMPRPWKFD